jgi:two-component system, LytTR family, response regulator
MKKISCVIVEDEPLARSLIEVYVSKINQLDLVASFGNPLEALAFLRDNKVDILFTDIQMPEVTGIALLKLLNNKPLIILTTAYSEYAIEGYELEVFDYLLKPISFERFLKSIEKAIVRLNNVTVVYEQKDVLEPQKPDNQIIFVKDGVKMIKINLNEITHIEGLKDYVCIFTQEKKIVTLQTLKSLVLSLPPSQFIRIHNSFIIAFNAIDVIAKDSVFIGKKEIPISDTYKKAFKDFVASRQIGLI